MGFQKKKMPVVFQAENNTKVFFIYFSQVDPIVASFSGGAVGVISTLMLLEANNVKQQEKKRCKYCHGTGKQSCLTVYPKDGNLDQFTYEQLKTAKPRKHEWAKVDKM